MNLEQSKIDEAVARKQSGQYNCAQAVACTYAPYAGVSETEMQRMANAFGGGMGCTLGTCGSIVGAGMVLGCVLADRAAAMKAMKNIVLKFQQRNGCTICRQLKGLDTGHVVRQCNDCVADASEFLEEELRAIE